MRLYSIALNVTGERSAIIVTLTLVYHRNINRLKCHHCGLETVPESSCPSCKNHDIKILGYGTERLEENLESFFPDTTVIRIDRDTTRRKKAFTNSP